LVVRASSSRWSFFLFPYVEYFDSYWDYWTSCERRITQHAI
jgi:hypothetical protein